MIAEETVKEFEIKLTEIGVVSGSIPITWSISEELSQSYISKGILLKDVYVLWSTAPICAGSEAFRFDDICYILPSW